MLGVSGDIRLAALCLEFFFAATGVGAPQPNSNQESMDAFLVATLEEQGKAIFGFDPGIEDVLEVDKESGLDCLELLSDRRAVDFVLPALAGAE